MYHRKKLCVKLVTYQNYTKMHDPKNIKSYDVIHTSYSLRTPWAAGNNRIPNSDGMLCRPILRNTASREFYVNEFW